MGGVISTQDLGYHPYYKKLVNQRCDSMSQDTFDYFYAGAATHYEYRIT